MGDLFGESIIYNKGPEVIQAADTPYGKIGVSICKDLAFPAYDRQAGEQQVDIMLNPYQLDKYSSTRSRESEITNAQTTTRAFKFCSTACQSSGRTDYATLS
jgi:predicted amidohydrolase